MSSKLNPIRFFATNRDLGDLGRDANRDDRIRLQQGGYHWVDMKRYMAHYLSTTDPTTMRPNAIVQDSQEIVFDNFLSKQNIKRIIIGIHGFNVPFHGALTSFSLLADTLNIALKKHNTTLITEPSANLDSGNGDLTAFVGFSWPSNGKVLDYLSDRAEAVQTAPALANLIGHIRTQNPEAKIHIIAHSMGNYLACNMLKGLINETFKPILFSDNAEIKAKIEQQLKRIDKGGKDMFFIDRYLMLAPDVERREVTQCDIEGDKSSYLGPFYAGIKHLVSETHLFYSRYDNALKASVVEKDLIQETLQKGKEIFTGQDLQKRWEHSLGLNPLPSLVPGNMYSHNATVLTNRAIDHGDYFDAIAVADKIAEIIMSAV